MERVHSLASRSDATESELENLNSWFNRLGHNGTQFSELANVRNWFVDLRPMNA
jgi:hypothetical protein